MKPVTVANWTLVCIAWQSVRARSSNPVDVARLISITCLGRFASMFQVFVGVVFTWTGGSTRIRFKQPIRIRFNSGHLAQVDTSIFSRLFQRWKDTFASPFLHLLFPIPGMLYCNCRTKNRPLYFIFSSLFFKVPERKHCMMHHNRGLLLDHRVRTPSSRRVTSTHRNDQGRTEGGKMTRAPSHYGASKSPSNVASTSFSTVHLLPKDLRFENWGRQTCFLPRASSDLVASLAATRVPRIYKKELACSNLLFTCTPALTFAHIVHNRGSTVREKRFTCAKERCCCPCRFLSVDLKENNNASLLCCLWFVRERTPELRRQLHPLATVHRVVLHEFCINRLRRTLVNVSRFRRYCTSRPSSV